MKTPINKWIQVSFFNLMLVAFIGIILRYKIAFALPFIDQKYLLHGHSHFAFAGWVTQILMVLLVAWLRENGIGKSFRKYRFLLYANLVTAYGMLLTFPVQGYGRWSIIFSVLSILVSYWFAIQYWRDINKLPASVTHFWFKTAVFFNAFSSIGVFGLAYIMATKINHPNLYLASVYFYLHFQYNGWMFFACMGLLCWQMIKQGFPEAGLKIIFQLFAFASVPAYLLSTLWLQLPGSIYILIILAVLMQLYGWVLAISAAITVNKSCKRPGLAVPRYIFIISGVALTIKLCLQAASVIPSLSKLAFGFRPIVIGYLHLILLGVITLFIIGHIIAAGYVRITKIVRAGLLVFISGIIFNETLLMTQGIADIAGTWVWYINYFLLAASCMLFAGLLILNSGIRSSYRQLSG